MSKLKPGGLAMMVRCVRDENNGKIVTLIKHMGEVVLVSPKGTYPMDTWRTDFSGPTWSGNPSAGLVPTVCLMPLDNPGDDVSDPFYKNIPVPSKEKSHV
jgi:hypothetical protein